MRKSLSIVALLFVGLLGAQSAKADPCNGFAANLIQNCAFGSGDFTSWSGTAPADPINTVDSYAPYNGLTYDASLGSSSDEDLSQTFATVIGQQYTVQFALLNDTTPDIGYINDFTATFGGTTLFTESNAAAGGYTLYSFDINGASTSTTLDLTSQNGEGYFELDSVSVAATPEPSSLLLFGTGILALAGAARRRLCR